MKCMWKAALAILVTAACGRDGAITEPEAPNELLKPGVLAIGVDPNSGASIETNKDDYLPGEIVHVVGKGWAPGETVNLHMTEMPDTHTDVDSNVVADGNGEFSVHYYDVQPHDLGVTFTLTATGETSGSVAVATFWDGDIQVEIAPAFYPSGNVVRRFSVLVRQVNTTATKCIKITVPYTASFVSVTGSTTGWSGSSASNVVTVTSANALSTTSDWVRVEVDATPPAGTNNSDWMTQAWTNTACTDNPGNNDDPVVNIGLTQNWTYTADFRDGGGSIVSETGSAGVSKTYRLRLTNTSGSGGDKGIFAVIAIPPCFSSPTVNTLTTVGLTSFSSSVRGTVIRLTGGELEKNSGHYVEVEFTTTPQSGCGTTFSTAMWKSAEHNSSENDTFVGNHPTITLGAATIGTSTEVLASPSPSVFGESVTFTATVTPVSGGPATGTVNFYKFTGGQTCTALGGASALGTDGTAPFTFATSALAVGSHTITACYVPNAGWTSSFDDVAHTVNKATVLVGVTDSPTSSTFGQSVTFTATVTAVAPGAGTPTGTVTFYEFTGGQTCTAPGGATGSADNSSPWEFTTSSLSVGAHTITACYGGDGNFNANSGTDTHSVGAIGTTTEVLASPSPSVFGESVTFTATVTPVSGGPATGTVNFYEFTGGQTCEALGGASALGTDGTAPFTLTTTTLSVATHTITACYVPNAGWASSFDDVAHTVNKATVLVGVSDNPTSSTFGQSVTFTATVTAVAPGAGTPTGTVTFYEFTGGQTCTSPGGATGSADASSPWEFTTSSLSVGAHTITACYGGDGNFNANSGTDTHSVSAIGTSTEVLASPSPSVFGELVTFTATVTPVSGGPATGTVNFYKFTGGQTCAALGGASALGTDGSAPFSFATSALAVGSHTITACYVPDAGWTSSFDDVAHTVNKATVLVGVSDSPTSSVFGQSVTFTATVTAVAPGAGAPTGTVTFYEFTGSQTCTAPNGATGTADNSSPWEFTTSSLSVGAHTITACYGGDGNFNANSGTDAHTVGKANSSVTVTDSPTSSEFGQSVTFTAALAAVAPGAGTPTGTVTFYEFAAGQTCAAPGGAAGSADASSPYQFTTSTLSVGSHTITACYGGNGNFNGNEGSDTHTVSAKSTTLSVAPSTQQYSDKTVLTATILPHTINGSALTGTVHFYVETAAVNCATPGGAVAVGNDPIADADDGVGSFTYAIGKQPSSTAYVVTACFTSSNTDFQNSDDTESLTVTKEDASVFDASVSPTGLQIPNSGGTLTFKIRETFGSVATEKNSQAQKDAGLVAAGNIDQSAFTITASAKGVMTPASTFTLACGTPTSNSQTGYSEILTVSCTFGAIGLADTYEVDIDVSSNHYIGEGLAVIQITDPNAGFATGGGWYWHNGVVGGDRVNFGFMAKSTVNNKKTVYQGSLLVIRHKANGDIIKIKSNVFDGYIIKTPAQGCPNVMFTGKANYAVNGVSLSNEQFTGYGEDCGEPGSTDKFGLWHAYSPNDVSTSTTLSGLAASAKTLVGGNVQVPQPSRR